MRILRNPPSLRYPDANVPRIAAGHIDGVGVGDAAKIAYELIGSRLGCLASAVGRTILRTPSL